MLMIGHHSVPSVSYSEHTRVLDGGLVIVRPCEPLSVMQFTSKLSMFIGNGQMIHDKSQRSRRYVIQRPCECEADGEQKHG